MSIYGNPVMMGGSGGGGGGDVPLLTRAQWDALSTAQKRAYGLLAIQDENSGFDRGELVYGADYASLLDASVSTDILAEGLAEKYAGGQTLGNLNIVGTPTINADGSLSMPGSSCYANMPSVADQSMTVYGVVAQSGSTVSYQRYMSIYTAGSSGREQLFCSSGHDNTTLIWSSFGADSFVSGFDATAKHLFVISADVSTFKSRFYLDGVYLGEKTFAALGYPWWTNNGGNQYLNGNFYYGAVVGGMESDAVILANSQTIMTHYGIS